MASVERRRSIVRGRQTQLSAPLPVGEDGAATSARCSSKHGKAFAQAVVAGVDGADLGLAADLGRLAPRRHQAPVLRVPAAQGQVRAQGQGPLLSPSGTALARPSAALPYRTHHAAQLASAVGSADEHWLEARRRDVVRRPELVAADPPLRPRRRRVVRRALYVRRVRERAGWAASGQGGRASADACDGPHHRRRRPAAHVE